MGDGDGELTEWYSARRVGMKRSRDKRGRTVLGDRKKGE